MGPKPIFLKEKLTIQHSNERCFHYILGSAAFGVGKSTSPRIQTGETGFFRLHLKVNAVNRAFFCCLRLKQETR